MGILHDTTTPAAHKLEMPGIEPGAFHMRSERSTTEPHPQTTKRMARKTTNAPPNRMLKVALNGANGSGWNSLREAEKLLIRDGKV